MRDYGYGKQTVWVYDRTNRETGVKAVKAPTHARILSAGRYQSTRTVAWQLAEYELNMLGPVPRGMEKMAADYARHFAGMRVSA